MSLMEHFYCDVELLSLAYFFWMSGTQCVGKKWREVRGKRDGVVPQRRVGRRNEMELKLAK